MSRKQKRSHKLRNTMLVLGGGAAAAGAAIKLRGRMPGANSVNGTGISTIDESIEVDVPVSTAYNQWTQFEEFPLFMEGVDDVQQRDDTRLHWVATIGGRTAEWDAKILEQHPDKQISWISEDGKKTRGTVTLRADRRVEGLDPPLDELPGPGPGRAARLGRRSRRHARPR